MLTLIPISNTLDKTNAGFSKINHGLKLLKKVAVPKYGKDYKKGDLLFTQDDCFLARAIYHFTRWDRRSGIAVAHVAVIADDSTCIEALSEGLTKSNLKKYFDNEDFRIFIRRPKGMTTEVADKLVRSEEKDLGKKYANALMVVSALRGSLIGHLIDKVTTNKFFDSLSLLVNKSGSVLCAQDVANRLTMHNFASCTEEVLNRPSAAITPQKLFETEEFFEPTIVQIH